MPNSIRLATEESGDPLPRLPNRILQSKAIRQLHQIKNHRTAFAILTLWGVVGGSIAFYVALPTWWAAALAILVIATRQQALAILVHDATHYRLFSNRQANNLFSDWLCAFPIFMSTSLYRATHVDHHRYLNSEGDPDYRYMKEHADWIFPKKRSQFLKLLAMDLSGLHLKFSLIDGPNPKFWSPIPRLFKKTDDPAGGLKLSEKISFVSFYSLLFVSLSLTHTWHLYLLFWILPMLTVLNCIFRIRTTAEHLILPKDSDLTQSRTTIVGPIEKLVLAPCNVNFHLEHHLFPGVPFYHLGKLHQLLMNEPEFREQAAITKGYLTRGGSVDQITAA